MCDNPGKLRTLSILILLTQEHDEFVTTKGNGNVAMYPLKN